MDIIRSIKKRMSNEYKKLIRQEEKRLLKIEEVLLEAKDKNNKENFLFLSELKKFEKRKIFYYKMRSYIGGDLTSFFMGESSILTYEIFEKIFEKDQKLFLKNVILPIPIDDMDRKLFVFEFFDLLMPYLLENYKNKLCELFFNEGPYEINDKVSLKKGDIVIDCGANMGFFSAIASAKGCKVFAFEPMKYIINNYLQKTSEWNKNITICPFALSNEIGKLTFQLDVSNIGASRQNDCIMGGGMNW